MPSRSGNQRRSRALHRRNARKHRGAKRRDAIRQVVVAMQRQRISRSRSRRTAPVIQGRAFAGNFYR
jgi:hypothetical protein